MSIFSFLIPKKTRSALVISSEIIRRVKRHDGNTNPINGMYLQKLLFIANGLHLAKTGRPLLTEPIEVWQYGPVVKNVFEEYKKYGNKEIRYTKRYNRFYNDIENEIFEFIISITCKLDVMQLANWTYSVNSPWYIAKESNLKIIPNKVMEFYFKQFLINKDEN